MEYTFTIAGIISLIALCFYIFSWWNQHALFGCNEEDGRGFFGKIWLLIYSPFLGLVLWIMLTAVIAYSIGEYLDVKVIPSYSIGIVAMNDGMSAEGSFSLGCGTIEGVSYYFYYQKLSNGGYKQDKIRADLATIFEDNTKMPRIQYYKKQFVDSTWNHWTKPNECDKVSIFVPKGSVKQNYNFDLQ